MTTHADSVRPSEALEPGSLRSLVLAEQARQSNGFIEDVDLDSYLDKLAAKAEFLSDCVHGRMRGVVAYYCNDTVSKCAYISLVLVDPADRGRGLGRALVGRVLEIARSRGFRACRLEVAVVNKPAYAIYRALGFTLVEDRGGKHLLEAVL